MGDFAIKGHPTRGREVIEILEMLGGEDKYKLRGNNEECAYFEKNGVIYNTSPIGFNNIKLFTLEEFLEKFPYKVGDNVMMDQYACTIIGCWWDESVDEVAYFVKSVDFQVTTYVKDLQPYKEQETMEEKTYPPYMDYDVKTIKTMKKEILPHFITVYDSEENKHEIVATDGYEIKEENGKFYAVKKKPQYPKTYDECAKLLNTYCGSIGGYNWKLLSYFQQLKICRDAYWKIAGEQMGLGKPWEPDWLNDKQDKYVLFTHNNTICSNRYVFGHNFLAFPTAEMRDAFYENFKDLIEQCKELL